MGKGAEDVKEWRVSGVVGTEKVAKKRIFHLHNLFITHGRQIKEGRRNIFT